ncbi:MAG: hypothetical protein MUP45_01080 [Candidatus Marinimicrobia bacterium]|nr:hypothetical protein [Candidatus Neomarinimicrobiota bacterium]
MLFSNCYRFPKTIVLGLIILGLGFYSYKAGPETEITYQDCLEEPEMCRDKEIAVLYAPIISQDEENLTLKGCQGPIFAKRTGEQISSKYVSVKGTFKNSSIISTQIKTHPYRYLKYLVSLIPVILVGVAFCKEFKFNFQRKVFKNA